MTGCLCGYRRPVGLKVDIKPEPRATRRPVGSLQEPVPAPGLPATFPRYLKPIPLTSGRDAKVVLEKVLAAERPQVMRWLYSSVSAAAEPLKFQEIRNSLFRGEVSQQWVDTWRQEYSAYVTDRLAPAMRIAADTGADIVFDGLASARIGEGFAREPIGKAIAGWIDARGADLAVSLSDGQHKAVQTLLKFYTVDRPVGAADIARAIRPVVGLTPAQSGAVQNYSAQLYKLVDAGELSQAKLFTQVQNYGDRLLRLRAERIANTELSFAFNKGQHTVNEEARAAGIYGDNVEIYEWMTAEDERVCVLCAPLDGVRVVAGENFPGGAEVTPPRHPWCRCTYGSYLLTPEEFAQYQQSGQVPN